MMDLGTVQTGLHTMQAGMTKGKTMAVAACVSACFLGAEAVFVPMAMNSSYERYEVYESPHMIPVEDLQQASGGERSRHISLTPIRKRGSSSGDGKAPVS